MQLQFTFTTYCSMYSSIAYSSQSYFSYMHNYHPFILMLQDRGLPFSTKTAMYLIPAGKY